MSKSTQALLMFSSVVASCAYLSACTAPDQSNLKQEVDGLTKIGDKLSVVEEHLGVAGYTCGPSYYAGFDGHICDRTEPGPGISGCIERVMVTFDRSTLKVSQIYVPPAKCAGL